MTSSTATADELHARAKAADVAADRAFRRWFEGKVYSQSAAMRLQNKADEAWADLRFHPDYDVLRHGETASYPS